MRGSNAWLWQLHLMGATPTHTRRMHQRFTARIKPHNPRVKLQLSIHQYSQLPVYLGACVRVSMVDGNKDE